MQEDRRSINWTRSGKTSPSGKLPTTWPVRYEDTPAYAVGYPGEYGKVQYGEGIFVGYRYFEAKRIAPLWCFGHGLNYSRFELADLTVSSGTGTAAATAALKLTNAGAVEAGEVVQLYVRDVLCTIPRPEKELKAFQKVFLAPGESTTLGFELSVRDLSYFDEKQGEWVASVTIYGILLVRRRWSSFCSSVRSMICPGVLGASFYLCTDLRTRGTK